jgi:phage tail-like protein
VPDSDYPYLTVLFRLSIGTEKVVSCSECTGLSLETTTEDYHEGGENRFSYKFPSVGQPPNLVLKRGIATSTTLWDWFEEYLETGIVKPRDGIVELLGPDTKGVRTWSFQGGYPIKWTGPDLNGAAPGVAFETLEIVHQGIRIKT